MGKNLDAELAEAARLDDLGPDEAVASESSAEQGAGGLAAPVEPSGRKNHLGLLVMLLLMVAAILVAFAFGFQDAAVYSLPVAQLLSRKGELAGRRVRIDGELVPGSLRKRDRPCEYRFRLRGGDSQIEVRYPQCVVPDGFRDMPGGGVMVTAEGELSDGGHFRASSIMAKCSSKYDPVKHEMEGAAPKKGRPDA